MHGAMSLLPLDPSLLILITSWCICQCRTFLEGDGWRFTLIGANDGMSFHGVGMLACQMQVVCSIETNWLSQT